MNAKILAAALALGLAAPAAAQEPPSDQQLSMSLLLELGFQIADMQYLNNSIVFALQNDAVAYICETTLNGETKICVRLK